MVDNALQGIIVHRNQKALYVNRAWADLFGTSVEDVLAMPDISQLFHEMDRERVCRYAADRVAGRLAPHRYRFQIKRPSGQTKWVEVFVRRIIWHGEEACQCSVIDVDDQEKQALELKQLQASMEMQVRDRSEALKASNSELHLCEAIINQMSDRISIIGTDYRYRMTNKANLDYYNKPIEAVIGHHIADIVGDSHFLKFSKPDLDRCLTGETVKGIRVDHDQLGGRLTFEIVFRPYRESDGGISGAVVTLRDITAASHMSERLAYQASHDALTGLVNRRTFEQHLKQAILDTANNSRSAVFCFIDLDQFKIINDTVGHLVGDQLLQQVASSLKNKIHEGDILARLGGDEFGLLLQGCSLRRAERAAEKLVATLNDNRFFHEGNAFEVGASIGITAINRYSQDVGEVMSQADLACYAAKDHGRNRVHIYKKRDAFLCRRREEMHQAGGIRAALDQEQFTLFAQPIERVLGERRSQPDRLEILLRMKGEGSQLIMPGSFIPAAERYGFMGEIDRWVIRQTITYLTGNLAQPEASRVNVNISGVTLNDDTLLDFVCDFLQETGVPAQRVCFEITETAAIRNLVKTEAIVQKLKTLGAEFALDDFGSGLSSLNYLKRLPVDYLKIDRTFIRDIHQDDNSRTMVAAIHQMAKALGIKTVAEGVEDKTTLGVLRDLEIDYAQGFEVGVPRPLTSYSQ